MKVKIIETCVYEVEAVDGEQAERLFVELGVLDPAIKLTGVTSRHVIEPSRDGIVSELHRFAEPGKVLPFPTRDRGPVVA